MKSEGIIELYRRHIPDLRSTTNGEWLGSCPYSACNNGSSPKFYVNSRTYQFHCKRCGAHGNAITFAKDFKENYQLYCDSAPKYTSPDEEEIGRFHSALLENREARPAPWREEFVRTLKVGWDKALVFPIFDEAGNVVNVIWHKSHQIRGARSTLYPLNLLDDYLPDYIVICEGLKDCVSLLSHRIQAVTSTGGATGLPGDISPLKKFKRIYLCLDADNAGDNGVEKWLSRLRAEHPGRKIRVCDLTPLVEEGGDVTDYLSLPEKDGDTFITEILERSRVGVPFSDVPNFIRQKMLSDEFRKMDNRDRLIYQELWLRATRFRFVTSEIHGQRVILHPGEYLTSLPLLAGICPPFTEKMLRTSLKRLEKTGFIHQRALDEKRGRVITLVGWSPGQPEGQTDFGKTGRLKFPFPPSIFTSNTIQNGQTESSEMGIKDGQHKELLTLGEEDIAKNNSKNPQLVIFDE